MHPVFFTYLAAMDYRSVQSPGYRMKFTVRCLQVAWRGEMTNYWQRTVELLFLVAWEGWTPDNKKCMYVCVQKSQQTPTTCHLTPPSMKEVGLGWSSKSSKVCRCSHSLLRTWHKLISPQVNQRRWSEIWLTRMALSLKVVLDPTFVHL